MIKLIDLQKVLTYKMTKPKSYRPIALLDAMGKVMEALIAERLQYRFLTTNTMPPTHYGGRKGV